MTVFMGWPVGVLEVLGLIVPGAVKGLGIREGFWALCAWRLNALWRAVGVWIVGVAELARRLK